MSGPDPGPTHRRRSRRRRWSFGASLRAGFRANRRTTLLLGGVGLILLAAIAVPLALGGGTGPATPPPGSSAGAATGSAAPAATLVEMGSAPAGSPAVGSPAPGPSALTRQVIATRIQIARLGIDLPVVEGDGVDAPLYKVAHYPGTAWPGGGSNIYLYGHARDGMFLSLWNAKVGDQVVLDLADGTQRTYVVTKVMPKVAWDDMALLAPTPHEQLTLQTCTSYEQTAPRFVVIAVPQT